MTAQKWPPADARKFLQAATFAGLVFGLDLLGKFGNVVGALYVAPILLVGLGAARQKSRIVAIAGIGSALTVAGFAVSPETSVAGVAVVNRVLALLAIWLAASLCVLSLRAEDYLEAEREFLPICASCKKIRDEEGQWNHPESYFSEQFAVTFTHGICPECVRNLYPAVVKKYLHYSKPAPQPSAPNPASGPLAG